MKIVFLKDFQIPIRKFLAVALLYGSTLGWFYLFHGYLFEQILPSKEEFLVWFVLGKFFFYGSIVLSGVIGSLICERVERKKFLAAWIAFGMLATASLLAFQGVEFTLFYSTFLGISFGLGFPACQAYLTESTAIEERGRISGIVIFGTFFSLVLILMMSEPDVFNLGVMNLIVVCVILKAIAFIALVFDPFEREKGEIKSWMSVLTSKNFLPYLLPWLLFHISNGVFLFVELPFDYASVATMGRVFEFAGVLVAGLVSGFMADYFGRKWPILIGLLMLGISYAFLGLVTTEISWLLVLASEGIAWGLITVSYMQVVLGDLSADGGAGSKEKFFALGGIVIPLFIFTIFSVVSEQWVEFSIPGNILSSVLSIMLFISVLPVLRASETLPEEKIRARRWRRYIKKLGELVEESKE